MPEIVIKKQAYEHCFFRGSAVGGAKHLETKVHGGGGKAPPSGGPATRLRCA